MSTIKNKIIEHLKSRADFDENSDMVLIDELVFNINVAKKARVEVKNHGIIVKNRFGDLIKNPAFDIYNNAIRNISNISTKLGISRQERMKLKQEAPEVDDTFEMTFRNN